jgi:hypothetical protein
MRLINQFMISALLKVLVNEVGLSKAFQLKLALIKLN